MWRSLSMLRLHTAPSASAVKKYFETADYYTQGQETVGRWGGRLAEELGLSGRVDKAGFEPCATTSTRRPASRSLRAHA